MRIRLDPKNPEGAVYEYSYGTGVLVGADGTIVTANHVVRDHQRATGRETVGILTRGSRHYLPVDIVAQDADSDIALLRASPRLLGHKSFFALGPPRLPKPGERSYVVGLRAAAAAESFEIGIIGGSFVDATKRLTELAGGRRPGIGPWITVSQITLQGYSGGAVLDAPGNLVGIVVGAPEWKGEWSEFSYGVGIEALLRLRAMKTDRAER
ncbi:MAG TPA: serine protease [Thermoanaerobaculia bacterium]|nr:serine protease [Thermoanaerobaculia bacterium]